MISRDEVLGNLEKINLKEAKIGVVGSHSGLDTCDGAKSEGFKTVAICQEGRDSPFTRYYKTIYDDKGNLRVYYTLTPGAKRGYSTITDNTMPKKQYFDFLGIK